MKVLDLFSGMGGWSRGFRDRGHEVVTVDIDERFEPTIVADLSTWEPDGHYDVVLASPPCIEFSKASMPWHDANPDTALLESTLRIIEKVNPIYWVIENVRGAVPYFEPVLGKPKARFGSRYLWGEFPILWAPHEYGKWRLPPSPERSALRAQIPRLLSIAMCRAMEVDTI